MLPASCVVLLFCAIVLFGLSDGDPSRNNFFSFTETIKEFSVSPLKFNLKYIIYFSVQKLSGNILYKKDISFIQVNGKI